MQPSINISEFCGFYKKHLSSVFDKFEGSPLTLCIVGGAVRDFIRTGEYSNDLDIEVGVKDTSFELEKTWAEFCKTNFKQSLTKFNVLKINEGDFQIEIAPARLEVFTDSKAHDNFKAVFLSGAPKADTFKRRDFTVNAIGADLFEEKLIDPYGGIKDIENKIIKNIDLDFFKDPVRFLRMIRFSINLGYSIDENLLLHCHKFNLSELSKYNFKYEFNKSVNKSLYLKTLFALLKANEIDFPVDLPVVEVDGDYSLYFCDLNDKQLDYFEVDKKLYKQISEVKHTEINCIEDEFKIYQLSKKLLSKNDDVFYHILNTEKDISRKIIFDLVTKLDRPNVDDVEPSLRSLEIYKILKEKYYGSKDS